MGIRYSNETGEGAVASKANHRQRKKLVDLSRLRQWSLLGTTFPVRGKNVMIRMSTYTLIIPCYFLSGNITQLLPLKLVPKNF